VHRWKATEFREFLLYSGFLVLDGILPCTLYDHLLLLFVAIRILMSPQLAVHYADMQIDTLYGKQTLVYNVIASFTLLLMLKNWDL